MIFVCDEGVDRSIVEQLRSDGHDVTYIAEVSPSVPDDEVLREANVRCAVLVTADKDFGELVFRLGQLSTRILLIRLHDLTSADRASLVGAVVREHAAEFTGAFLCCRPPSYVSESRAE
jgi:predicted nuclease of predicted toxin-antitoxin system